MIIITWLIFLSINRILVVIISKIAILAVISAWQSTGVVHLVSSSKIKSRSHWCDTWFSSTREFAFEEASSTVCLISLVVLFLKLLFQRYFYYLLEIQFLTVKILIKSLNTFNLINLRKIHLILYHGIPRFNCEFQAVKLINLLHDWFSHFILFHFRSQWMSLILLEHLFSS